MKGLPKNLPDLEDTFPFCILIKATKISICVIINVSQLAPGFMLQMDFAFFNFEVIFGFNPTYIAVFSANSYPFGFTFRSEYPPLDILKFLVTTLRNQDKKVALIRVD